MANPCVRMRSNSECSAATVGTVRAVSRSSRTRSRYACSSWSGNDASSTRPIDVAYAGNRVPTLIATVMMRLVGTRATYTMSSPSRTDTDDDSRTSATSRSRCGSATSGSDRLDRNAYPSSMTRGVRENIRPSDRTYPRSASVSRNRRAPARVRSQIRATSLSVSSGWPASNARITASPRSSDWTKCGSRIGSAAGSVILGQHFLRDREGAVRGGHPGVDRGVQQDLADLLGAEPVAPGRPYVQGQLVVAVQRGQQGQRHAAAGTPVQDVAGPDLAPGVPGDEVLEAGGERCRGGERPVDVGVAEHLPPYRHAGRVPVVSHRVPPGSVGSPPRPARRCRDGRHSG